MKFKNEIIDFIREVNGPVGSRQVSDKFKLPLSVASRKLRSLAQQGYLQRHHGNKGNIFLYTVGKKSVNSNKRIKQDLNNLAILPEQLQSLLEKWSTEEWNPRIFQSAPNLPQVVAYLYKYAVELSFGNPVDKTNIIKQIEKLNEFKHDLEQTLSVVNSILSTRQLTSPTELAIFLLSSGDPVYFRETAEQVLANN